MIESVEFRNFKALKDTTLPLGRCTVIVGPNGSGKSTALSALHALRQPQNLPRESILSLGAADNAAVEILLHLSDAANACTYTVSWGNDDRIRKGGTIDSTPVDNPVSALRIYSLDAKAIAEPARLQKELELNENGAGFVALLDRIRDKHPERFDALSQEMSRWFPEFDRFQFDVIGNAKAFALRLQDGRGSIPAADLSQGTLLGLAMLTLAYLPDPPPLVGFEEVDRGLHPRLLRDVQESMYRLSYPENFGETRDPVQVVATTHSPYFLDLFRDHPEEIVIAEKRDGWVQFERLSDRADIDEILADTSLGEVWYSGVLGGVPEGK